MNRAGNGAGNDNGQLSFDFYSMICPEMSAAEAIGLFENTKLCKECGRRLFSVYANNSGEVGIAIKCMQCKHIVTFPILKLIQGRLMF